VAKKIESDKVQKQQDDQKKELEIEMNNLRKKLRDEYYSAANYQHN